MYSKGPKKRRGAQEKEERVSITIYLDKKVWNDFQKFIAPSGISVSRMMEAIMRVACDPPGGCHHLGKNLLCHIESDIRN